MYVLAIRRNTEVFVLKESVMLSSYFETLSLSMQRPPPGTHPPKPSAMHLEYPSMEKKATPCFTEAWLIIWGLFQHSGSFRGPPLVHQVIAHTLSSRKC